MHNNILLDSINQRISEIRREIQVLTTEERKLFFAAKPLELMISMPKIIDLKKELARLEKQVKYYASLQEAI